MANTTGRGRSSTTAKAETKTRLSRGVRPILAEINLGINKSAEPLAFLSDLIRCVREKSVEIRASAAGKTTASKTVRRGATATKAATKSASTTKRAGSSKRLSASTKRPAAITRRRRGPNKQQAPQNGQYSENAPAEQQSAI